MVQNRTLSLWHNMYTWILFSIRLVLILFFLNNQVKSDHKTTRGNNMMDTNIHTCNRNSQELVGSVTLHSAAQRLGCWQREWVTSLRMISLWSCRVHVCLCVVHSLVPKCRSNNVVTILQTPRCGNDLREYRNVIFHYLHIV